MSGSAFGREHPARTRFHFHSAEDHSMRLSPASRWARWLGLFAMAASIALVAGCGKGTGSVTGKVTYGSTVLKGGNVGFVPTDGGTSYSAAIGEDGVYTIPKLFTGNYKVCVETDSLKSASDPGGSKGGSGA